MWIMWIIVNQILVYYVSNMVNQQKMALIHPQLPTFNSLLIRDYKPPSSLQFLSLNRLVTPSQMASTAQRTAGPYLTKDIFHLDTPAGIHESSPPSLPTVPTASPTNRQSPHSSDTLTCWWERKNVSIKNAPRSYAQEHRTGLRVPRTPRATVTAYARSEAPRRGNPIGGGAKARPPLPLFPPLTSFLAVVVGGVELRVVVGDLHAGDDQVVLLVGRVRAQDEPVDGVVLPLGPARGHKAGGQRERGARRWAAGAAGRSASAYRLTSGSHCTVRLGHSSACVITRSYRKGVFFFHILYSSFMTRSSTASSYTGRGRGSVQVERASLAAGPNGRAVSVETFLFERFVRRF